MFVRNYTHVAGKFKKALEMSVKGFYIWWQGGGAVVGSLGLSL